MSCRASESIASRHLRQREPSLSPVDARRGYLLGLRKSNFKQEWQNKRHEALTRHDT